MPDSAHRHGGAFLKAPAGCARMGARAVIVLLGLLSTAASLPQPPPRSGDPLETALARPDRVAQVYQDHALRFTCDETLVHYNNRGRKTYRFEYIYIYDESKRLVDYRVKRFKGKKKKGRKDRGRPASLERYVDRDGLPPPLLRAYSWIFIFEKARWHKYDYELAGEREILGRPAIGVRFEPIPPYVPQVNDWFGTAWVDRETYQLLRVEAIQAREHAKRRRLERNLKEFSVSKRPRRSSHIIAEVFTDYGVEVNGLRLPSEVMLRGSRYNVWAYKGNSGFREQSLFRLKQSYENYQFFGVRTAEQIFKIVFSEDPDD